MPYVPLVAAAIAGFSGLLFLPLWVNQVVTDYGITESAGGYLAAIEFTAVAVSSFFVSTRLARLDGNTAIAAGFCALLVGNLLPIPIESPPVLLLARLLVGLGAGVVLAYVHAAVAFLPRPDRAFAIINFSIIAIAVAGYAVALRFIGQFGSAAIFLMMFGISLICFLAALVGGLPNLQRKVGPAPTRTSLSSDQRRAVLGALAFYIAEGTLWAYIIRMGAVSGVSPDDAGYVLSTTLALGLVGPLLAESISSRIGRTMPLVVTLACLSLVAWCFGNATSSIVYFAAVITLNFAFVFVVIYSSSLLAAMDPSGRLAAKIPGLRTLGNAAGPWLGAVILEFFGYGTLGWLVAIVYLAAAMLLLPAARELDRAAVPVG